MTKTRSYQLLDFVEIKNNIESQQLLTPRFESQIRPLAKLEPDQQTAVWKRIVEQVGGKRHGQASSLGGFANAGSLGTPLRGGRNGTRR